MLTLIALLLLLAGVFWIVKKAPSFIVRHSTRTKYRVTWRDFIAGGVFAVGVIFCGWALVTVFKPESTPDFSFSLQCHHLESNWDKRISLPYSTAVFDYERASREVDKGSMTATQFIQYKNGELPSADRA
jgi:hypothetical protein